MYFNTEVIDTGKYGIYKAFSVRTNAIRKSAITSWAYPVIVRLTVMIDGRDEHGPDPDQTVFFYESGLKFSVGSFRRN